MKGFAADTGSGWLEVWEFDWLLRLPKIFGVDDSFAWLKMFDVAGVELANIF